MDRSSETARHGGVEARASEVLEPAARLCAAARVLVRHGEILDAEAGDRLLAEIDAAADVLREAVSSFVRFPRRAGTDAA
jgi:hypothetical protein